MDNTFYMDFSIADRFGEHAIKDTYRRSIKAWAENVDYMAELVIALNHKIWQHYYEGDMETAKLYDLLWREAHQKAVENFEDEELRKYLEIID